MISITNSEKNPKFLKRNLKMIVVYLKPSLALNFFFAKMKKQLAVTVSLIERESNFFEKFLDGFCKTNCQLLEVIV
jgi:hypothetical protein